MWTDRDPPGPTVGSSPVASVYADDGGSQAGSTDTDFDGLGHYRTHTTDGTFAGSDVRVEWTNYNPNRHNYTRT